VRTRYLYFPHAHSRSATSAWSADGKKGPKNQTALPRRGKVGSSPVPSQFPGPGTRPRGRL